MKKKLTTAAAIFALVSASHGATIIRAETFDNTTEFLRNIRGTDYQWNAAFGDTNDSGNATLFPNNATASQTPNIYPQTGASGSGDPVTGYLRGLNTMPLNQPHFYFREGLSLGSAADFVRVELDLANQSLTEDIRATIKIDSTWYVSTNVFNSTVVTTLSTAPNWTNNLNTVGSTWAPLTYTLGSPFVVGAVADLPITGDITGVGVYNGNFSNTVRLDNVEVWVIPEPSTSLLAGMAAFTLAFRRRK